MKRMIRLLETQPLAVDIERVDAGTDNAAVDPAGSPSTGAQAPSPRRVQLLDRLSCRPSRRGSGVDDALRAPDTTTASPANSPTTALRPPSHFAMGFDVGAIEAFVATVGASLLKELALDRVKLKKPVRSLDLDDLALGYEAVEGALEAFACGGSSGFSRLDHFLAQASTAYGREGTIHGHGPTLVRMEGDHAAPCLLSGNPDRLRAPASLAGYFDCLWQHDVRCVLALAPPSWLPPTGEASFGDVALRAGRWLTLPASALGGVGRATFTAELRRGDVVRDLTVVDVAWPDFQALPPQVLASLVRGVDRERAGGGLAVHCGAGLGRTGTFVLAQALSQAWLTGEASSRGLTFEHALLTFLRLRLQRAGAVETSAQFAAALQAFA